MNEIKTFSDMVLWADELAKISWPKNGIIHIANDELLLEMHSKMHSSTHGAKLTSCNIKLLGYDFVVKEKWKYEPKDEDNG